MVCLDLLCFDPLYVERLDFDFQYFGCCWCAPSCSLWSSVPSQSAAVFLRIVAVIWFDAAGVLICGLWKAVFSRPARVFSQFDCGKARRAAHSPEYQHAVPAEIGKGSKEATQGKNLGEDRKEFPALGLLFVRGENSPFTCKWVTGRAAAAGAHGFRERHQCLVNGSITQHSGCGPAYLVSA